MRVCWAVRGVVAKTGINNPECVERGGIGLPLVSKLISRRPTAEPSNLFSVRIKTNG